MSIVPLRDILADDRTATMFDYLSFAKDSQIIVSERDEVDANIAALFEQVQDSYRLAVQNDADADVPVPDTLFMDAAFVGERVAQATQVAELGLDDDAPAGEEGAGSPRAALPVQHVRCQPAIELKGRVADWVAEIRRLREEGDMSLFVAATAGRAERTVELLKEHGVLAIPVERAEDARYAALLVAIGALSRGFRLPDAGLQIYAEADVFEEERRAPERRRSATKAFLSDLRDLKVGDFVVHIDHGIGMFVGLKQITVGDGVQEFLELRYSGEDKLFVPVERLDLVQKYSGATRPPVDRLGGVSWERAKTKVKKAMRDMAEQLLRHYAARKENR